MWPWLQVALLSLNCTAALLVGYLLLLTAAASRASRQTPGQAQASYRFRILVPAHNEERLLPELLQSLAALDYPPALFTVHVVADNCVDRTATVAREAGARVHERQDAAHAGKGHALNWLLERVSQTEAAPAAWVFLDADSVVSPNFLKVMAARLERGQNAIQAHYTTRTPERSAVTGLRFAALAALHYLRPQGRMKLGFSAGLKGNGMVVAAGLMQRHRWSAAVTEDIELHMDLLLAGERVHFAPDAMVWGEMPDSLAKSQAQHQRWEAGRVQMAHRYIPRLLRAAREQWGAGQRRQAAVLLDAVLEHVIPPFSVLVALSGLLLCASLVNAVVPGVGSGSAAALNEGLRWTNLSLASGLLAGQALYLFAGLAYVGAPRTVYLQLLLAPAYMVWKLGQYARMWLTRNRAGWVRTTRNAA
jgi:cellulose synthase/poly-beta-1,6-N-acetylglucosamine synthase-like glycosyltransferase